MESVRFQTASSSFVHQTASNSGSYHAQFTAVRLGLISPPPQPPQQRHQAYAHVTGSSRLSVSYQWDSRHGRRLVDFPTIPSPAPKNSAPVSYRRATISSVFAIAHLALILTSILFLMILPRPHRASPAKSVVVFPTRPLWEVIAIAPGRNVLRAWRGFRPGSVGLESYRHC